MNETSEAFSDGRRLGKTQGTQKYFEAIAESYADWILYDQICTSIQVLVERLYNNSRKISNG